MDTVVDLRRKKTEGKITIGKMYKIYLGWLFKCSLAEKLGDKKFF